MKRSLKTDLHRLKDAEFLFQGRMILACRRVHPLFVTGPVSSFVPTVERLEAVLNAFEVAASAAATRDIQKVAAAKKAREEAAVVLLILAKFYEAAAVADPQVLENTGFELQREATPTNPLSAQLILSLAHGTFPGEIIARTDRVPGAASYEVHMTDGNPLDPDWPLKKVHPKSSYMLMSGLNGGGMYYAKVRIISSAGVGPWSNAVSIRVL